MLPSKDCDLCPRLVQFRIDNAQKYPAFFNGAVPAFGSLDAEILVVGLAPGLKGANQTGRPFTGDYAGDVLYQSLLQYGLAEGNYQKYAGDGLQLRNVRITNAVRCVPPQNKPEGSEVNQCSGFLTEEILSMSHLKAILTLGLVSHKAVVKALGLKQKDVVFSHGAQHSLAIQGKEVQLYNSYHCSRYNINTGRLSQQMFDEVVKAIITA